MPDCCIAVRSVGGWGQRQEKHTLGLHDAVSNFYADDQRMIALLIQTLKLTEAAVKNVESVLGLPGTANPYNLPKAAEMLGVYAMPELQLGFIVTMKLKTFAWLCFSGPACSNALEGSGLSAL